MFHPCDGWMMVIMVLPTALEPAAFYFIDNAGQLFVFSVFSFKMFSARLSCLLTSVSETQSEAARIHLSAMSRACVQTKKKKFS